MKHKYKTRPMKHQAQYMANYTGREHFANFSEMGTGKSWIAINEAADQWSKGIINSILIIAPKGVHDNWTYPEFGQLSMHMPDWCDYIARSYTAGMNKTQLADLDNLYGKPSFGKLRILSVAWDSLITAQGQEVISRFVLSATKLSVIADEAHKAANPKTKRTESFMVLRPRSVVRRIITGTPYMSSPFNLFSQMNFLSPSILDCEDFVLFKSEHAIMLDGKSRLIQKLKERHGIRGTPQIVAKDDEGKPMYRNLDRLSAQIAPHMFRVLKKDCLDLPEKIYKTVLFELSPEQRRQYNLVSKSLVVELNEQNVPLDSIIAKFMKLSQIISGFIIDPETGAEYAIPGRNPKLELLQDRCEDVMEYGHQAVIWTRFRMEVDMVSKMLDKLGATFCTYTGDHKSMSKVNDFQAGHYQFFVSNIQAGSTGTTLTAATRAIYLSNPRGMVERLQSEDRTHRIGSNEPVIYEDLIAARTIDAMILQAFKNHKEIADVITGDKRKWVAAALEGLALPA